MQQIIISGVGGQGVLFVTRILAEGAINSGLSVLISETHGMAQRGGNVISHLKVWKSADEKGGFSSPLIRPGRADILLALHPDAVPAHGHYLRHGGVTFLNSADGSGMNCINAARVAEELGSPLSANLVLLGFAAASEQLFCTKQQVEAVLAQFKGKKGEAGVLAFQAGIAGYPQS